MSISHGSGARGFQRLPSLKYYYVMKWKVDSLYSSMLLKLPIILKNASNKSCYALNFVQKSQRTHMSICPRSGARGLRGLQSLKYYTAIMMIGITLGVFHIKPDSDTHEFSENSRECWMRIGEQVMCGLVYSYVLGIRHYALNAFSALPNLSNRQILERILANTIWANQFLQ